MAILDWLFRRTPTTADPAPPILPTRDGLTFEILVADGDSPDHLAKASENPARRYILEPFFFLMEYTDVSGAVSRRRITTRHVDEIDGVRYLRAICHERRALRTFRLDRITCIITQDGEIEAADTWFEEILASADIEEITSPAVRVAPPPPQRASVSPYTTLRRAIDPGTTLLIAAARSDDYLHPGEMDTILRYVEDEAVSLRDAGTIPNIDADMFDKMERTLRRLRPTRDDLTVALGHIEGWNLTRKRSLLRALAQAARADGTVDPIEADLIAELNDIGARKFGFGWIE